MKETRQAISSIQYINLWYFAKNKNDLWLYVLLPFFDIFSKLNESSERKRERKKSRSLNREAHSHVMKMNVMRCNLLWMHVEMLYRVDRYLVNKNDCLHTYWCRQKSRMTFTNWTYTRKILVQKWRYTSSSPKKRLLLGTI